MIPMVNLKAQYVEIKDEIERGLAETIENCSFILGPNVQAFEKKRPIIWALNTPLRWLQEPMRCIWP